MSYYLWLVNVSDGITVKTVIVFIIYSAFGFTLKVHILI